MIAIGLPTKIMDVTSHPWEKGTRASIHSDQLQQPFTLVVSLSRGNHHHMPDTIHFSAEFVGDPYNIVYFSI